MVAYQSDRALLLFEERQRDVHVRIDRMFAKLLAVEWLAAIAGAVWLSPLTWSGAAGESHVRVYAAILLGAMTAGPSLWFVLRRPGQTVTRHVVAVTQMLMSALLIHVTGGRIETHFHVFASLAFLALYRDWTVLVTGSVVVVADHFLRGVLWPESVYGVAHGAQWRWLEHAAWVAFTDVLLIAACRQSVLQMRAITRRQAELEDANAIMTRTVAEQKGQLKEGELRLLSATEVAERSSRAKSDFLATMSHELRTPLNSIIGFSEMLVDHIVGDLNARQDRYCQNILTSGKHLLQLINDILDLSTLEAGGAKLELSAFDLCQTVRDIETVAKGAASRKAIGLTLVIPDDNLPPIRADQPKFKQILYNLVSNAIKFTPQDGSVCIRVLREDGDTLHVSVADTGIGIAPEDQKRIFNEFEQLNSSYAREQQGTGLGLALTWRLVALHGGKLWLESAVGSGSTFHFTIPYHGGKSIESQPHGRPVERPTEGEERHEERSAEAMTILVVDDEPIVLDLLDAVLRSRAHHVLQARNLSQALRMAEQQVPDAIILDLDMPNMSGQDVLRALHDSPRARGIPVIIFTSAELQAAEREELNKRVQAIASKSCLDELLGALQRLQQQRIGREVAS